MVGKIKPPIRGLLDRHHAPPKGFEMAVRNFVIDVPWKDLQAAPGAQITPNNLIDQELTAAGLAGMRIKLRVGCGIDAPEWAKNLDGPPFSLYYTDATVKSAGSVAGTCGRFWTPKYLAAYVDLQKKLAAKYDANPVLGQTCITMAGTIFSEPYLRNAQDDRNVRALLDAGFTSALDEQAHYNQVNAHRAWKHTVSSLTFNPYQRILTDGTVKKDLLYTLGQMVMFRATMPYRTAFENYSISQDRITSPDYGAIYAKMQELGAPFDFQTATFTKVGDLLWVLDWAATLGANSVELPSGYTAHTVDQLGLYATRLANNPVRSR